MEGMKDVRGSVEVIVVIVLAALGGVAAGLSGKDYDPSLPKSGPSSSSKITYCLQRKMGGDYCHFYSQSQCESYAGKQAGDTCYRRN
jgi:hypothetical protein